MPYKTSLFAKEPPNHDARLWRYMDLQRFISILDRKELYFPSAATLSKCDPFEGEPALEKIYAASQKGQDEMRWLRLNADLFKHLNFFNCWHMNDGESDAMWKLYSNGNDGVAIQSTVTRIKSCFDQSESEVYMGMVNYDGRHTLELSDRTDVVITDYMLKRPAFKHEQEVRLGTYRSDVNDTYFERGTLKHQGLNISVDDILLNPKTEGVNVGVDVEILIEKLFISPLSHGGFSDLVISITKKLGYTFEVVPSDMSRNPPLSG